MRLFVAARLPPERAFAQATRDLQEIAPRARPVPEGTWHATLRFLGEVEDVEAVRAVLGPVVARHAAMPFSVEGVGAFPNPRRARVAWAGVHADGLASVAADIAAATVLERDPERGRAFHAHATLARLEPAADIRAFVQQHNHTGFARGFLTHVTLFASETLPQGPRYTAIGEFPLAA